MNLCTVIVPTLFCISQFEMVRGTFFSRCQTRHYFWSRITYCKIQSVNEFFDIPTIEPLQEKKMNFAYPRKKKAQISCEVIAQLISTFVFATCDFIEPGRKPHRLFTRRGSPSKLLQLIFLSLLSHGPYGIMLASMLLSEYF